MSSLCTQCEDELPHSMLCDCDCDCCTAAAEAVKREPWYRREIAATWNSCPALSSADYSEQVYADYRTAQGY